MEIAPALAVSLPSRYCKATWPGKRPSFSAMAMRRSSSKISEAMMIGAFVPSVRRTTPEMVKATEKDKYQKYQHFIDNGLQHVMGS